MAEMEELGYVEGENTTFMVMDWAAMSDQELFNSGVEAMLDAGVDVLVANTDVDAVSLQELTGDVPIVFARSNDPIATGAVESLAHPGGNITGVLVNKSHERRLQILTEVNPQTQKVYYLYSPLTLDAEPVLQRVQELAEELDVEVVPAPTTDPASGLELLENIPDDVDWLFLTPYVPFDMEFSEALLALSTSRQIAIAGFGDFPSWGYLLGYGANLDATAKQAADIVDLILRGANPADLPLQTAENFLTVDLVAAEAIGWEIPGSVLRQANTIVRSDYWDEYFAALEEAQAAQEAQDAQETEEDSGD
jgi:putative ABC transport system substrate-binding protein